MQQLPRLSTLRDTAHFLTSYLIRTPTLPYYGSALDDVLDSTTRVVLKLELLQRTGSFKPRGALNVMRHLDDDQRRAGVTAFSAGNHAIATAFAARALGISAKVAMPATANPFRVQRCRELGAEIVFADSIGDLLGMVERLQLDEGRTLVHPFEGAHTTEGTATVGLELCEDAGVLDAVIVPVGGGGLISGIATAIRLLQPDCMVYGVEPEGACGMSASLTHGAPLAHVDVSSIADSLGAPLHLPYSFSVIQQTVDDVVTISDTQLIQMMRLMFTDLKLAVEPATAAAMAALVGPLRPRLIGKRVGIILCGANIDMNTFIRLVG